MSKKIKIGVFGAGRGLSMIEVCFNHPDAEVVAVCDKYVPLLDRVKRLAEEKGIEVALFEDFEDFIKYELDAVVLANYASEHAPYAVRCLKAGLHVLSECLTCASMAQAVELIEAVEESGKVYAYAENYAYAWATFEMWQRFQNGDIGDLVYAEGEYVHDCSSEWPQLAYGDRNHWRNDGFSTFYCTHGLAPILAITDHRPVKVSGFETYHTDYMLKCGIKGATAGVTMITMDNGAIVKGLNGNLRHASLHNINASWVIYGTNGQLESPRNHLGAVYSYEVGGECKEYMPERTIEKELADKFNGHGGADFYATHFFIEQILGKEIGKKYSIDVYKAVDMCICGLLAFKSILAGGIPVDVPDLRDPAQRDKYRNDHACTFKYEAGDQLLPYSSYRLPEFPDSVYEEQKVLWEEWQKKMGFV